MEKLVFIILKGFAKIENRSVAFDNLRILRSLPLLSLYRNKEILALSIVSITL